MYNFTINKYRFLLVRQIYYERKYFYKRDWRVLKNVLKYNDRNIKCTAYNTRFAKSGNNCFNLKIIIKFEITAPFEDFVSKCRLRQAVETLGTSLKHSRTNNKIWNTNHF